MNRILTYLTIWVLCFTNTQAQDVFYQDMFNGGVTCGGFSTGLGPGSGQLTLFIEPSSTVKRAYLFAFSLLKETSGNLLLNGDSFVFDQTNLVHTFSITNIDVSPVNIHAIDITDWLSASFTQTFNLDVPSHYDMPFGGIFAPFVYIAYENASLPELSTFIVLNRQDLIGDEFYPISEINPIETTNPVGFSVFSDRVCSSIDGTEVYVNSNFLGLLSQSDQINNLWGCGGVKGHFYYQNGTLFGLDDDNPDGVMSGSDGLADISSYLVHNSTSLDFRLTHFRYPNQPSSATNLNLAYFLTYTTPCSSFPTALIVSDTTICEGQPLQLGASGGINYNWLPQTGLSCYDCPNPAFTGDSSTVYTVRIWSTDSCSKVLPVHVKVNPKPKFESIQVTPSGCGKSTGSIVAMMDTAQAPYQYTLDNQAPQLDSLFTGLASGNYALSVENVHGCTNDTLLTIHEELSVTASFIANPATGSAPLWVQTENTSTNATDYLWEWSGGTTTDEHPGFTLDTAGNYTLTLIAYDGAPHCSDTFSLQVLVYDSLQVSIPNVFTPNQDGRNDFFGITTNVSVSGRVTLFNRWGNSLHELEFTTQPQVFEPLWDGTDATEGVYFYQLELTTNTETYSYSGFVQLVR